MKKRKIWPFKMRIPLGFLSLLILINFSGCFGPSKIREDKGEVSVAVGKQVYGKFCSGCHGVDMSGSRYVNFNLLEIQSMQNKDQINFVKSVSEGVPNTYMKGFGERLLPSQMKSVYLYLQTQLK
jgi:mono/diheme cytochrome c family protein